MALTRNFQIHVKEESVHVISDRYDNEKTNNSRDNFHFLHSIFSIPINRQSETMILPFKSRPSGRNNKLNPSQKATIAALLIAGKHPDFIVKECGVSRSTVYRVREGVKYTEQNPSSNCKKAGRPKKTTEEMDNFLVELSGSNRKLMPK